MKKFIFIVTSLAVFSGFKAASQEVAVKKDAVKSDMHQKNTYLISGKVLDSANHSPLVSATVYVKNVKDSTVVSFALTDDKGAFMLRDIPKEKELMFNIFYTGYKPYHKELTDIEKDTLGFGIIRLAMASHALGAVTITGEAPPIAIKGDTIQFNAASFKTRPNSVLADLLKKLPGVDVDQDGSVTAMGKKVDKILVNGKKFFGDDPQIALQNLPAAIVDKVQITDTKTQQEELTGEPASGGTKTINITLKKGMDHGFFGRAYAGYGTGKHYDASGLVNYFDGNRQISFLGAINNINQTGFTINEIAGMLGRNNIHSIMINKNSGQFGINGMNFGGGGVGLKRTTTAGINYNDEFGKHISVNGSYFYGSVLLDNETKTARQNILPDSLFNYNSDNTAHSNNLSHRVNATINYKDSLWNIRITPSVNINDNRGTNQTMAASTGLKGQLINQSNSLYTNDDQRNTFSNELSIYRTFRKKGQYLYFGINTSNSTTEGKDYNNFKNIFYDGSTANDSVNQFIHNRAQNNSYSVNAEYAQPITKDLAATFAYGLQWQNGLTDKKTYDYNDGTGKYSEPDTAYSNKFKSDIITQSPKVGLNIKADSGRWNFSPGITFNFIGLHHYSYTHELGFDQNQFFVSPNLYVSRRFKKSGSLNLRYNTYIRQPDISQLLPVADNTNPLYLVKGNPDLKPSVNNNIYLSYDNFDFKSGNAVFLSAGYNFTKNDIVNVTTYDAQLRQLTTYTNVDGNNGFNVSINISKTRKKENYHWQVKLGSYGALNNNHSFVNEVPYASRNYNIWFRPSVTYGYKELFEVTPSYTINYQYNKYDIQSLNNSEADMNQAGLSGTLYWPARVTWTSDWTYTHNSNVAPGFRKGFWLWNASVGLDVFKSRQGTIQLSVYDLLNQNISVQRTVGATYTEDTQTIILHRYFMLKFIYNLRKVGEKKKESRLPVFFF